MISDSAIVEALDSLEAYKEAHFDNDQNAPWYGPESLWYGSDYRVVHNQVYVRELSIRMIQTWRDYGYIELLKLAHVEGSWLAYPKGPNLITDTELAHYEALIALRRAGLLNRVNTDIQFPQMKAAHFRIEQHYPYSVSESYPTGTIFGGNGLILPNMNHSPQFFEKLILAGYTLVTDCNYALWRCFVPPGLLPCWTTLDLAQDACRYWESYVRRYDESESKTFGAAIYCQALS